MSDFAQTGLITTLQRLNETHLEKVEAELAACAQEAPIALVLPCHGRELGSAALAHIVAELKDAAWLSQIVVTMNGLDEPAYEHAQRIFDELPQRHCILWNDREGAGGGKGENIAAAFRLLAEDAGCAVVVTQDCDVASFRRADLARLCFPVARLGYRFAKAYYPRVTDRLYGRVTRLFFAPLLQALVRVAGHQPLLDFLMSFRYPLSGEVAMTLELAGQLPVANGYALETAQLCDVFRVVDPRDVCQVGGSAGYDHRHQPADPALAGMAKVIADELFSQLGKEGIKAWPKFRADVKTAYRREAGQAVRRSAALARINGLPFDEESECAAIIAFAEQV